MQKLILIVVCLISLNNLLAQPLENTPYFRGYQGNHCIYQWTTSNGLPQSHVSGITQSRNKLIWISTYNGVVTYDGKKFTNEFILNKKKKISPFITSVYAIGDTIVWTSTKEVVVYYNHKIIQCIPFNENNIFIPAINSFDGHIYLFSHQVTYELKSNKLVKIFDCNKNKRLRGHTLLTTVYYQKDLVYLTRKDNKNYLIRLDPKSLNFEIINPKKPILNISVLNGKLYYQLENAWYLLNKSFVSQTKVKEARYSAGGTFSQSSIKPGLDYYYTGKTLEINRNGEQRVMAVEDIIQNNELFSSFVDHTGNLWLGTNSNGLIMLRHYPFSYPALDNNLKIINSSHSFVDKYGLVWFDNECTETFGINLSTKKIEHHIPNLCNWSAIDWENDSIALFGYGSAHNWYNKKTGKISEIKSIPFVVNYSLVVGKRKVILGSEGGVYLWNGKKATLWKKFQYKSSICSQITHFGDVFFFATTEGIYQFKKNKWTLLINSDHFEKVDFRSILLLEKSNQLILGTSGEGLMRYNLRNGKIDRLAQTPSQLRDCWSIIKDRYNQLWISSNNGITEVALEELQRSFNEKAQRMFLNHYRFETGIQNVEFNSRTSNKGYLLPTGEILFSCLSGPTIIELQNNKAFNKSLAGIFIERIDVNSKSSNPLVKTLKLMEDDFVQLHFTLPTFSLERVLQFEYRIKGYRDEWTPLNSRQIIIDHIPTGSYKLEIKLSSGKRKLELPVEVQSKHPYLWILYLMLTAIGILGIVYFTARITRYFQHKKNQTQYLEQKLKIMEVEALRSQMNPHFTFNCLNTIQFLFMSGNSDKANKYLSDFSSLMRMTLDNMRSSISTLDMELKLTQLYVNLEQLQFDNGFEFRVINNIKTPHTQISAPTMFLQLFVENAIIHGLKHTQEEKPVLTLSMDETEKEYIFRVSDNGPGYGTKAAIGNHKSVGLDMLRERLNLKSELYNWNIEFNISQSEEIKNDIRTTVTISFGKTLSIPI